MPLTTNWDIYYRDTSTPASLETESATQATSIEDALNAIVDAREIQTYKWANTTERSSQIGMVEGDIGFQADTDITYRYNGTAWVAQQGSDDTGWTAATLLNSWVAFGGVHVTPGYRKVGSRVEFRGTAKNGTVATIFTLPTGYRPLFDFYYIVMANGGVAQLSVSASTGNVAVVAFVSPATNAILSLQGVSFYTD